MGFQIGYQSTLRVGDQPCSASGVQRIIAHLQAKEGEQAVAKLNAHLGVAFSSAVAHQFVPMWQIEAALDYLQQHYPSLVAISSRLSPNWVDDLASLLANFDNLEQVITALVNQQLPVAQFADTVVISHDSFVRIIWINTGRSPLDSLHVQFQHSINMMCSVAERLLGEPFLPLEIALVKQPDADWLQNIRCQNIRSQAPFYSWTLSRKQLQQPLNGQIDAAPLALQKIQDSFAEQVIAALRQRFPQLPTMEQMAQCLDVSDRTLRRKLAAGKSRYQNLIYQVRCQHALRQLVTERADVASLAEQMGFNDVSHFRQSFKHWTGFAPGDFMNALDKECFLPSDNS
ncbi:helix-turn-helix transcriptional regulator [Shewanella waksmanii]|uniref:helix-turn-helix transcriptional regulator n=1 Tax=Shewanella waksmanii TaxID=213783 RepID=UPI003736DB59